MSLFKGNDNFEIKTQTTTWLVTIGEWNLSLKKLTVQQTLTHKKSLTQKMIWASTNMILNVWIVCVFKSLSLHSQKKKKKSLLELSTLLPTRFICLSSRCSKTDGLGRFLGLWVRRVTGKNGSVGLWVGLGWPVFFIFYFFLNYKNKSMTTCLERMNKIN